MRRIPIPAALVTLLIVAFMLVWVPVGQADRPQTFLQVQQAGANVYGAGGYVKLNFTNCTVTNANGGAQISCAGGSGPSGNVNDIQLNNGSGALTGSDALKFDGTTLTVGTQNSVNGVINLATSSGNPIGITASGVGLSFTGSGSVTLAGTGGFNLSGSGGALLSLVNGSSWTTGNGGTITGSPTSNLYTLVETTNTAATLGQSQSTALSIQGKYWNGASANDIWTITNSLTNGLNGPSTLTFGHTGTSGLPSIAFNAPTKLNGVAVASLPSAAATTGVVMYVTDSTAVATEGQTCTGGSSNAAMAFSNGSVWKCF